VRLASGVGPFSSLRAGADLVFRRSPSRSLAIQSSTIKHYLPLLLPFMPDLSELILSCKVTLRDLALLEPPRPVSPDDAPLLASAVPLSASTRADGRTTTMPSPTNLQLEISEPLSARLIETLLRSSLVGKIEDLGISSRFIRAGLMADAVELSEAEIVRLAGCPWSRGYKR
jgi:hypothetical protein